jgi:hypothetical protein
MGLRTLQRHLAELIAAGLITRVVRGRHRSAFYWLHWDRLVANGPGRKGDKECTGVGVKRVTPPSRPREAGGKDRKPRPGPAMLRREEEQIIPMPTWVREMIHAVARPMPGPAAQAQREVYLRQTDRRAREEWQDGIMARARALGLG